MFVGSIASGRIVNHYPPLVEVKAEVVASSKTTQQMVALPEWDANGKSQFAKALGLKEDSVLVPAKIPADYSETDAQGTVTHYDHASLVEGAIKADRNADQKIDRQEWAIARRRQWPFIWLWPAAGALITCIIFVIGFRERVPTAGEENVGFQAVPEEAEP